MSLRSALWKEEYFLQRIDADHLNQIGWWDRAEARAGVSRERYEQGIRDLYVSLAEGLRE